MLTHIVLMGRLTRDPELRYTQSQTKGSMAAVSGRLQIREWTDREGGKRTTAEVVADNVYFGESKRRDGGDTSRPAAPSASAPAHRGSYGGYDNVPQGGSAFSELDDDDGDLPF